MSLLSWLRSSVYCSTLSALVYASTRLDRQKEWCFLPVRSSVPNLWTRYFENETSSEQILMQIGTISPLGKGMKLNFGRLGGQRSRSHEAWLSGGILDSLGSTAILDSSCDCYLLMVVHWWSMMWLQVTVVFALSFVAFMSNTDCRSVTYKHSDILVCLLLLTLRINFIDDWRLSLN